MIYNVYIYLDFNKIILKIRKIFFLMKIPFGDIYEINIHKEGEKFVLIFFFATLSFFFVSNVLFTVGIFLTLCCIGFFRDPERIIPRKDGVALSPADGKVTKISVANAPAELKELEGQEMIKISIFLSVFDVHVNRVPVSGKVTEVAYVPGKFFNAGLEKSSSENERNCIALQMENGTKVGLVQIAGLIARRIVSEAKIGSEYGIGDKYGIIRFGSRVDLYLPVNSVVQVSEGQTVIGGETILSTI